MSKHKKETIPDRKIEPLYEFTEVKTSKTTAVTDTERAWNSSDPGLKVTPPPGHTSDTIIPGVGSMEYELAKRRGETPVADKKTEQSENPSYVRTPAYDPTKWVDLPEQNTTLFVGLKAIVDNSYCAGVPTLEPSKPLEEMTPEERNTYDEQLDRAKRVLFGSGSLIETLRRFGLNREFCGFGSLVLKENGIGEIDSVEYLQAHYFKHRMDGWGSQYTDPITGKVSYYKRFDDSRSISRSTGLVVSATQDSLADRAWHLPIFSPTDPFYGMPRWISAKYAAIGNNLQSKLNVLFFDNATMVRFIVIVNDPSIDPESIQNLEKYLNMDLKGVQNAHRCMVLKPKYRGKYTGMISGGKDETKNKIELVKLMMESKEDALFQGYRVNNDSEIHTALRLPMIYYGGSTDRGSFTALRQLAFSQVFIHEINLFENLFNTQVLPEIVSEKELVTLDQIDQELPKNKSFLKSVRIRGQHLSDFAVDAPRIHLSVSERETLYCKSRQLDGMVYVKDHPLTYDAQHVKQTDRYVFYRVPLVRLQLIRPEVRDGIEVLQALATASPTGAVSPNDAKRVMRDLMGLKVDLYPAAWGNKPLNLTVMEINSQVPMEQLYDYVNKGDAEGLAKSIVVKKLDSLIANSPDAFINAVQMIQQKLLREDDE